MKLMRTLPILSIYLWTLGCTQNTQVDLILINASIFNGEHMISESVIVIHDDQIKSIHTTQEYQQHPISAKDTIDLEGRFTMPGLIEAHGHIWSYGQSLRQLSLSEYHTWDEIVDAVQKKASQLPSGQWIIGRGWHQEKWTSSPADHVNGFPRLDELSNRVPDHPVYLEHASGHAAIINEMALQQVGISQDMNDPEGGRFLRDDEGKLIGVLEDLAMNIVQDRIDKDTDPDAYWESELNLAGEACLKNGITTFHDAGTSVAQMKFLKAYSSSHGLPVRVYVMLFDDIDSLAAALPDVRCESEDEHFLTCRAIKTYYDGALGSRGAWMLQPYTDDAENVGLNLMTPYKMQEYINLCKANELQYCVHAIGDRANRLILDMIENNFADSADHRSRIEHAQHVHPDDQSRFAQTKTIASMQPIHCTSDAPYVHARLGKERSASGAYVWRSLLANHTRIAVGTDVPVEPINPFENMYAAVTRKGDPNSKSFYPSQVMTRQEILQAYTSGNAYAGFEENIKGRIEQGFLADIVVIDRDLLACSEDELKEASAALTILGGKIKHSELEK